MIFILPLFTPPDRHNDIYRNVSDKKFNEMKNIIIWRQFINNIGGLEELLNNNNIFLCRNSEICSKEVLKFIRDRIYYWA